MGVGWGLGGGGDGGTESEREVGGEREVTERVGMGSALSSETHFSLLRAGKLRSGQHVGLR